MDTRLCDWTKKSPPFSVCTICKTIVFRDEERGPIHICIGSWLHLTHKNLTKLYFWCGDISPSLQRQWFQWKDRAEGVFTAGTHSSILIELTGSLQRDMLNHFEENDRLTELQAEVKGATKQNWYQLVHAGHFHACLLERVQEDEVWQAFPWHVTLSAGGHSLNVLRQMARGQSARKSKRYFMRTTFLMLWMV